MKPMHAAAALTFALAATASAQETPLAAQLPAGALLTLETRNAGPALGRLTDLIGGALRDTGLGEDGPAQLLGGFEGILTDSLGREGVAGVFTVQGKGGTFTPALLAVARTGDLSGEVFRSMIPQKKGARVGAYPFVRSGNLFAGQANGLVYVSSDKALLMSYLGRLSGKAAPTLAASAPYAAARGAAGNTELGLYANFSATAKVLRSQFAQFMLPRLLSPVVDALDTLGQVAGGLTTTDAGLSTVSAQVVNTAGKDRPLARILTDTTDFAVQDIIPADAEAVQATACAPESNAYAGRWLTRLDLLEPFGFLTDSQLASHLERAGQYLGSECAQVTLAGGTRAGLDQSDPLASLAASVAYQSVRDRAAAEAHLPEYVQSVNEAIAGLRGTLKGTLGDLMKGGMGGMDMEDMDMGGMDMGGMGAAMMAGQESLDQIDALLGNLKMVYAFRGDYLITAFSEQALQAALDEGAAPLAQDPAFQAAALDMTASGGWSYQPDLPELSGEDLLGSLPAETAEMDMDETLGPVMDAVAGLINRYDGMTSQRTVAGNVIIGKANVKYRW
ncbi:hypothetical protein GCM10008959_28620 [Deinococcus seoulensis]|uniref:DUF3352 domain-containing protein n=1 Tax=Deinococcus seoulensis TaxID=1837379 RepID=A0ABQ2RTC7_9DEIO|nr:hypothetical protein [Deinococcus seoulensis]GGR64800.1 hypothetical protein GCM10008959_28620 [Deinococcus seoulensis]